MSDNSIVTEARKWIDELSAGTGLHGGWRLETLGKRYRYYKNSATGKKVRVPIRIRRFAKGIPWALVFEALKYLEANAPYSGIVFNGVATDVKYRPTSTMWRRDDQQIIGGNAQGSYTLIQDLIEDGANDGYGALTTDSCIEEVLTEWVWDSAQVDDLPCSEQGVTYSIQALHRNEDGTFNYSLVKRVAKTQVLPEEVVNSSLFETLFRTRYDNVYGVPGAFRDHTGTPIEISEPETEVPGELVTREMILNDDCTYKITVDRRVSHPVVSDHSSSVTVFERESGTVLRAQPDPLAETPASNGVITSVKSEKRPDGVYDNTKTVRQELPVTDAVVETKRTTRGTIKVTTNRNQAGQADAGKMSLGTTVRNEQTPGGRWNQTVSSRVTNSKGGDLGGSRRATVFSIVDEKFRNELSWSPSVTAGGGRTEQSTGRLTDEGTYDVTDSTVKELQYNDAVTDVQETVRAKVNRTTHRNLRSKINMTDIGTKVVNEVTDGGLYNVTATTVSPYSGSDRSVYESDAFSETKERTSFSALQTRNVPDALPGANLAGAYRKANELDENGVLSETERVSVEKWVPEASKEVRITQTATITTVSDRGSPTHKDAPVTVGSAVANEKTPTGCYTVRSTDVVPRTGAQVSRSREVTAFKVVDVDTVVGEAAIESAQASSGTSVRVESRYDDNGVPVSTTTTTREVAREISDMYYKSGLSFDKIAVRVGSSRTEDLGAAPASGSPSRETRKVITETTENGGVRITTEDRTLLPYVWTAPVVDSGYSYHKQVFFKNQLPDEVEAIINKESRDFNTLVTSWVNSGRGPQSVGATPSFSLNPDTGVLDGSFTMTASWLPEQAGTRSPVDFTFVTFTYSTSTLVSPYSDKYKGFTCLYLRKHYRHVEGRGAQSFAREIGGTLYDASYSFNPRTQIWQVTKCVSMGVSTNP